MVFLPNKFCPLNQSPDSGVQKLSEAVFCIIDRHRIPECKNKRSGFSHHYPRSAVKVKIAHVVHALHHYLHPDFRLFCQLENEINELIVIVRFHNKSPGTQQYGFVPMFCGSP